MPGVLKLKDRMTTPPGGFCFMHPSGQEIRGISMQSVIQQYSSRFGGAPPPNIADQIDSHTCVGLEKQGFYHFFYEIMPKVKEQGVGRIFELDAKAMLRPGGYYYNPGLVDDLKGNLWLIYRRQQYNGDSDICLCQLGEDYQPIGLSNMKLPIPVLKDQEMLEDPRVIRIENEYYVSLCSWQKGTPYFNAYQRLCVFNLKWEYIREVPLFYGMNGTSVEKNWTYFKHNEDLMILYKVHHHDIAKLNERSGDCAQVIHQDWPASWIWGDMRGGSPAVRVGREYFAFYHSRYNDGYSGRPRYVCGCYAFDATSFKVTRYTDKPLLRASENDPSIHWAPWVVFPNGALFKDDKWIVSIGINDLYCAIWELDHHDLLGRMKTIGDN